ncbi:MAG: YvcK family protein [Solirubrobacterales bacterium]|nr:YvcK family protein [Solirubrobacterales bacterium]MBV9805946.1 YvcK family protein [Solirubrobacterales bacterium]
MPQPRARKTSTGDHPRVVAFGGGTGLPALLQGLRRTSGDRVCGVVTVADDGGSSGRLRQELGIAPPGDVRRCLVALAERRGLAEMFEYRFEGGVELRDHSVGNLIIAALAEMSGGFAQGVEQAGRFLRIKGSVQPAATESMSLILHHADGTITHGESTPRAPGRAVQRVTIEPPGAEAPAAVIRAIERADLVVLSPGSLFTSTIASMLGARVPQALAEFGGPVIYVANVMTQPGETVGMTLSDHLRAIAEHVGPVVTDALVHAESLPPAVLARYRLEGAEPVRLDSERVERLGVRVHAMPVLPDRIVAEARHDPDRLATAVLQIAEQVRLAAPHLR